MHVVAINVTQPKEHEWHSCTNWSMQSICIPSNEIYVDVKACHLPSTCKHEEMLNIWWTCPCDIYSCLG